MQKDVVINKMFVCLFVVVSIRVCGTCMGC